MQFIDSFTLPSENAEAGYLLSYHYKLEMASYTDNVYPFKLFPNRLERLELAPVTMLYGGNGSGKSTLLNIIAEKLKLQRGAPFNETPFFEEYLKLCKFRLSNIKEPPKRSRIITSDDVFDYLLDIRAINKGVDDRREQLSAEYEDLNDLQKPPRLLQSLDDYDEIKRVAEAKSKTKSKYVSRRLPKELNGKSNGESAFAFFTHEIGEKALYLLDEPENSLSVKLQLELTQFILDSARFYDCQFIISTHSPFMLSMKGAEIYDLDSAPVVRRRWTELENVRAYFDFFDGRRDEFSKSGR